MSPYRPDVAGTIFRRLNILIATTVLLFLMLLGMGIYVYGISRANTKALCAFRRDAERRVVDSNKFLAENPNGIPGISAGVIQRGIQNAQSTADSLKYIHCPPPPAVTPNQKESGP